MRLIAPLRRHVLDLVILFVALAAQAELAAAVHRPEVAVLSALAAVALLVRRRLPYLAVVASFAAQLGILIALDMQDPITIFAQFLLTFVVAGTLQPERAAWIAYGSGLIVLVVAELPIQSVGQAASDFLLSALMSTALFVLTLLLSRRARSQRVLAERAAAAEHSAAESAERAAADERERIAREMHDVVAHSVTIAVVQCVAALDELDRSSDPTAQGIRPRVEAAEGACREALAELRRMLSVLRYEASDTTPAPRLDTLGHLAESVRRTGLAVDLAVEGDLDRVPPGVGLACYRIVQESLTNTLKHADASHATVDIAVDADEVRLRVEDDGRAPLMTHAGGNGLVGMRERAGAYAGTLQAGPRESGGYCVEATLPLDEAP